MVQKIFQSCPKWTANASTSTATTVNGLTSPAAACNATSKPVAARGGANRRVKLWMVSLSVSLASASAFAEPLAEFDALVKRCQDAFDQRPAIEVVYAEPVKAWVKRQFAPTTVVSRVQKTSSPVSTFVGQIEVTQTASAQRGEDEHAVRALDVSTEDNVMRSVHRISLAFQDNRWTPISGAMRVDVRRDVNDSFTTMNSARHSREALLELQGPIAMCMGQPALFSQSASRVIN